MNTQKVYNEDDYLMLSGIQHFVYCKRQWSLIHVEQQWADNALTMEGQIFHEKADDPYLKEKRKGRFFSRAIPVSSKTLGLSGILDVVEFNQDPNGIPLPHKRGKWSPTIIEFKRGRVKDNPCDVAQLVAEVICLEETLHIQIPVSYLFYKKTRRRVEVAITDDLRQWVADLAAEMHDLFDRHITLGPEYCTCDKGNSLKDISMAEPLTRNQDVDGYIARYMDTAMMTEE